jgi:hypothetical protein
MPEFDNMQAVPVYNDGEMVAVRFASGNGVRKAMRIKKMMTWTGERVRVRYNGATSAKKGAY